MKFEYQIPAGETVVKRLFADDDINKDKFAITQAGDLLIEVSYPDARRFWLGRVSLAELLQVEAA